MENNCDNILKIVKESFNKSVEYNKCKYTDLYQPIDERIQIDKIITMNIANYLKSVEVYSKFCNKDK